MIQHDVQQGSPEWKALRAGHFCASDAPAAMGLSKYKTRQAFLLEKKTGVVPEVDPHTQSLYDAGHASEAAMRPVAEGIIGEDLFPTTGSEVIDGLPLLASFDGISAGDDVIWENKLSNATLAFHIAANNDLPDTHWPQVEQQLLISGAEKALFTCGDERIWYVSKPERRARLLASWKQFAADLETFVPPAAAAPAATAAVIESLPALVVQAEGKVTTSNLPAFREAATAFLAKINTELTTDQHFADAKATVKVLEEREKRLEMVKAQVLAQAVSIDEVCRGIDTIAEEFRQMRLKVDRLVKSREAEIKAAIITKNQGLLDEHRATLNKRLGADWVPRTMGGFADAIKGKRSLASCEDAASTALANEKIEMSALADRLELNRKALVIADVDYSFLFADFATVGTKPVEDFGAIAMARIAKHREDEAERKRKADEAAAAPVAAPVQQQVVTHGPVAASGGSGGRSSIADTRPPIPTSAICEWIGFTVTVEFLKSLGIESMPTPAGKKGGTFWAQADKGKIRNAIMAYLSRLEA